MRAISRKGAVTTSQIVVRTALDYPHWSSFPAPVRGHPTRAMCNPSKTAQTARGQVLISSSTCALVAERHFRWSGGLPSAGLAVARIWSGERVGPFAESDDPARDDCFAVVERRISSRSAAARRPEGVLAASTKRPRHSHIATAAFSAGTAEDR